VVAVKVRILGLPADRAEEWVRRETVFGTWMTFGVGAKARPRERGSTRTRSLI
jgi:hypothetical protein